MKEDTPPKKSTKDKIFSAIKIIASLFILSGIIGFFLSSGDSLSVATGNVAVIPLHGVISVEEGGGFGSDIISSDKLIASLQKAKDNPNIKAILLDINSPGGSAVATDEISQKIKSINKTTVAVIREVGASGAYWIASSADYIFANRLSIVGSIGVYGSYLDFSGLMKRYNVTYQRLVSGEYKDMGSPYRETTKEEQKILQQLVDKMRLLFVEEVAANRNITFDEVNKLATGQIFLGAESKKMKLIDDLGTKDDALKYIEKKLNITAEPVEYKEKIGLKELLAEISSSFQPKIGNFINSASSSLQLN